MEYRLPPKLICFGTKPRLDSLCVVILSVQCDNKTDIRAKQILKCRELIFTEPLIIASPDYESDLIFVIMQRPFYKQGNLQPHIIRMGLKQERATSVSPEQFEACLQYTLLAKLAPNWNKVGTMLVKGRDFLSAATKTDAVVFQIVVTQDDLHASVQPLCVKIISMKLHDLNISHKVIQEFSTCVGGVIQEENILQKWCHILPSMKKGQVIEVTHTIPPYSPFKCYADLKKHWKNHYGYRLPEKEEKLYYSVYFKLIGEQLFTYPACCIKSCEPLILQCTNPTQLLATFFADIASKIPQICGQTLKFLQAPGLPTNYNIRPVLQALYSDERPNIKKNLPDAYRKQTTQPNFTTVLQGQANRSGVLTPTPTPDKTPLLKEAPPVNMELFGVLNFCQQFINNCAADITWGKQHTNRDYATSSSNPPAFDSGMANSSQITNQSQSSSQRYRPIFKTSKPKLPVSSKISQLESMTAFSRDQVSNTCFGKALHSTLNAVTHQSKNENTTKIVPTFKKTAQTCPRSNGGHKSPAVKTAKNNALKFRQKVPPTSKPRPIANIPNLQKAQAIKNYASVIRPTAIQQQDTSTVVPPFLKPVPQKKAVTPKAITKLNTVKTKLTDKEMPAHKKPKPSPAKANDFVDVEAAALANQLSKMKASVLLEWLKKRGVAVRAKDKKLQLLEKVGLELRL